MQRNNLFFTGASSQVRVHHFSNDGSRPDERDLNHEVVEVFWLEPWKCRHLGAAFHLEHADRIALLQRLINQLIVLWKFSEVDFLAPMVPYKREAILEDCHHAQAQKIYLDDTHVSAVFLVPLNDDSVRHRGRLQRDHAVERALTHNHAPGML